MTSIFSLTSCKRLPLSGNRKRINAASNKATPGITPTIALMPNNALSGWFRKISPPLDSRVTKCAAARIDAVVCSAS